MKRQRHLTAQEHIHSDNLCDTAHHHTHTFMTRGEDSTEEKEGVHDGGHNRAGTSGGTPQVSVAQRFFRTQTPRPPLSARIVADRGLKKLYGVLL
jgi:hypothetical protein